MNIFKKSSHSRKMKKAADYAKGAEDTRLLYEAQNRVEVNRLKAKITKRDNRISELIDVAESMKSYMNDELGEYLLYVEDIAYQVRDSNDVKRIATQTVHKNVDALVIKTLFYCRKLRKKLTKVKPKVHAAINKVV
jgi:hypothetical protein